MNHLLYEARHISKSIQDKFLVFEVSIPNSQKYICIKQPLGSFSLLFPSAHTNAQYSFPVSHYLAFHHHFPSYSPRINLSCSLSPPYLSVTKCCPLTLLNNSLTHTPKLVQQCPTGAVCLQSFTFLAEKSLKRYIS